MLWVITAKIIEQEESFNAQRFNDNFMKLISMRLGIVISIRKAIN